jgi:hypothetical protein
VKTIFVAGLLALCATLPAAAGPPVDAGTASSAEQAQTPASLQLLVMLHLPPQHYQPDTAYAGRYPNDSGRAPRRRAAEGRRDWPRHTT